MAKKLTEINNELKSYVNEAKFISNRCRNKLLKILALEFSVDLPLENYANIDVQLTEEGDIIMRGDKYESTSKVASEEELLEKYQNFCSKADVFLNKKNKGFEQKRDINNVLNMVIVVILTIVYLIIIILTINAIFSLQLFTASILIAILSSYLYPGIRNRFEQVRNYLKHRFRNK